MSNACAALSEVSTHSRPKAAGTCWRWKRRTTRRFQHTAARRRLVLWVKNGGWIFGFQHTAARRRLAAARLQRAHQGGVSTHSRLKAAGSDSQIRWLVFAVSTHSRLKAAGQHSFSIRGCRRERFNTQPPEGGWTAGCFLFWSILCFNTQPPEGGWPKDTYTHVVVLVSTHSRLKAAGWRRIWQPISAYRFNTQPPEGGWDLEDLIAEGLVVFQHTAA